MLCAGFCCKTPGLVPDGWLSVNVVCVVFLLRGPSFRSRRVAQCESGVCCVFASGPSFRSRQVAQCESGVCCVFAAGPSFRSRPMTPCECGMCCVFDAGSQF